MRKRSRGPNQEVPDRKASGREALDQEALNQEAPDRKALGQEALDLVLMDVLNQPERLGDLRRRGLVGERTQVVAVDIDHRVPTEAELARRAALWGVRAVPDGARRRHPGARASPAPDLPAGPCCWAGHGRGSRRRPSSGWRPSRRSSTSPPDRPAATTPSGCAGSTRTADRRPAHWGTVETTDLAGLLCGPPRPRC